MRGKVNQTGDAVQRHGITPAYAGKRVFRDSLATSFWDHPRVCGEKGDTSALARRQMGSPPRMRGKVTLGGILMTVNGITPAYAGKSLLIFLLRFVLRDHPRVCGEKTQKALKYKCSFFQVLIFHLTSDRSQVSAHSLSVLDGSQSHPVPNKRILPQGNNCSVRQVSVGPASGYL